MLISDSKLFSRSSSTYIIEGWGSGGYLPLPRIESCSAPREKSLDYYGINPPTSTRISSSTYVVLISPCVVLLILVLGFNVYVPGSRNTTARRTFFVYSFDSFSPHLAENSTIWRDTLGFETKANVSLSVVGTFAQSSGRFGSMKDVCYLCTAIRELRSDKEVWVSG